MSFIPNAEGEARQAMVSAGRPELAEKFMTVIRFLAANPKAASNLRRKTLTIGSFDYIQAAAAAFAAGRVPRKPEPPSTVPDEMVSYILQEYFGIPAADLEKIKRGHLISMRAENMVGDLLERYLADSLEKEGWVWISGSLVKGADFLKPPPPSKRKWQVLQVKNRDNSENSSSSAIREGTSIQKWFRTFSKQPGSNWGEFPDAVLKADFSEDGFKEFVRKYLLALKKG
ncbi:MAG: SinI family restriction endonuclease [Acidobacteria bacterium]|nr:SinI family restriction endonuclease [Acidobacteriota bacterium]